MKFLFFFIRITFIFNLSLQLVSCGVKGPPRAPEGSVSYNWENEFLLEDSYEKIVKDIDKLKKSTESQIGYCTLKVNEVENLIQETNLKESQKTIQLKELCQQVKDSISKVENNQELLKGDFLKLRNYLKTSQIKYSKKWDSLDRFQYLADDQLKEDLINKNIAQVMTKLSLNREDSFKDLKNFRFCTQNKVKMTCRKILEKK
jgi:hypothetical protein